VQDGALSPTVLEKTPSEGRVAHFRMGLKRRPRFETLDEVILSGLRHEYSSSNTAEIDTKLRRSLHYYGFDVERGMERVPLLRNFKNRLLKEFSPPNESPYFVRAPQTQGSASMHDFDLLRLKKDMAAAFPSVDTGLVGGFVNHAIYLYYLR
jgi:hypothetical protein